MIETIKEAGRRISASKGGITTWFLKGLFVATVAFLMLSVVAFMSYFFVGSHRVPLLDFYLDFLKGMGGSLLMAFTTMLVILFIWSVAKRLYMKIFGEEKREEEER